MKPVLAAIAALVALPAAAHEFEAPLRALAAERLAAIAADPTVTAAIAAQNRRTADLDEAAILALDADWRAQIGAAERPMIDSVLENPAGERLRTLRAETAGLITEIFAMDARGLNVAASDITSDYWQGDEAKWQKTFLAGPDALHLDDIAFDESTQTYQAQVSLPVADPESGAAIGAVTFGVDITLLR